MEKNSGKTKVTIILIIVLFLIIGVLSCLLIKTLNDQKMAMDEKEKIEGYSKELEEKVEEYEEKISKVADAIDGKISEDEENEATEVKNTEKSSYLKNFSSSVSKELGEDNIIWVTVNSEVYGIDFLEINNKGEAFINPKNDSKLEEKAKFYEKIGNVCKIGDNIAKIYWCETGQAIGDDYIIMITKDGDAKYIKFDVESNGTSMEPIIDLTVKNIKNANDITEVIPIEGNDENGIGGVGFLLIKSDGTCMPYFTID